MLAVIETGGKQYLVSEGTIIDIEKIETPENNKTIKFEKILLISDNKEQILVGKPYISNGLVSAEVLNQHKDKKKIVFKFKSKTGYQKKQGHRQNLTTIRIQKIELKTTKKTSTKIEEVTTKES